jgi:uncharacterized phosphosugar-binding protein
MLTTRHRGAWILAAALLASMATLPASEVAATASTQDPPILTAYRRRLAQVRRQLPAIIAAADAVAQRWVSRKGILIQVPMLGDSSGFATEMTFRAGGLDNVSLPDGPDRTSAAGDVVVYAPRSWETGAKSLKDELAANRRAGMLNVVFASSAGAPADAPIDVLIDNGAAGGGRDEAALNQIVNITNGWLWQCELTAALTRRGYRPGIIEGMTLPGSTAHNKQYQLKPRALYAWDKPIAAGEMANAYLRGLQSTIADLDSGPRLRQLHRAADMAVERLHAGHNVWVSSFTHALESEEGLDITSPMKAFDSDTKSFTRNLKKGDLLFWFGEWTVNTVTLDYVDVIRQTGADYIPSYRPTREPMEPTAAGKVFYDQRLEGALMVLEQRWPYENAVVDTPFPPGKMAPVSGVYVSLLYRMLDEEIATRARSSKPAAGNSNRGAVR